MGERGRKVPSWSDVYAVPRPPADMYPWAATHRGLIQELLAYDRILELGTGTGMMSAVCSYTARLAVTLDNDADVLSQATRFYESARARVLAVRGDAFSMPFSDGSFDVVFSQGVLEHWSDVDIVRSVHEQMRVAKLALISVPSSYYPRIGPYGPGLIGNERWLSARRWKQLLNEFYVEAQHYSDWKVFTLAGFSVPWPNHLLVRVQSRAA